MMRLLALLALTIAAAPVGAVPVRVAEGSGIEEEDVARRVAEASGIVAAFAKSQGWEKATAVPTFDSVEVFARQAGFWKRILELDSPPSDTQLAMDGLTAALEARVLLAVSPEEYRRLRPEYGSEADAWTQA